MSAPPSTDAPAPSEPQPLYSASYLRYGLGLLTVVYVVNFVDRQILAILLESIKQELDFSDFQLGLLGGTAFGIFYATMGVPIARLADVYSRKWVMAVCLVIWSVMTALCGMAVGFWSLLLLRIGVGIGEAGGSPPAHSMISDYFPAERRGAALGVFSLGVPLGILVGFGIGGWLEEAIGWRWTFAVVGLPGVLLAAVLSATLREPPRGHSEVGGASAERAEVPSSLETARFLWRSRSFRHAALAAALYAFVGYSVTNWAPPFLIRSHGLSVGEVGTWLALIVGIGGGFGIYLGGAVSDRWSLGDARYRMWIPGVAMFLSVPFSVGIYTTSNTTLALVLLIPPTFLGLTYQAPTFALVQSLATPSMRATAGAILLLIVNIVGLAMGPAATGLLSDALVPRFGEDSLRYAMLIVSMVLLWSGLHFMLATRSVREDLAFASAATLRESRGESIWG